eukprot:tig00001408_g8599.t1
MTEVDALYAAAARKGQPAPEPVTDQVDRLYAQYAAEQKKREAAEAKMQLRTLTVDPSPQAVENASELLFTDLKRAVDAASARDTVLLKPGTHIIEETLTISKNITVKGSGDKKTDAVIEMKHVSEYALVLGGAGPGTISNFAVKGGVNVVSGTWTVTACDIAGQGEETTCCALLLGRATTGPSLRPAGASAGAPVVAKVTECVLHNAAWGVYIGPGAGNNVAKNEVHNCREGGIGFFTDSLNVFVENNVVHDCKGAGIFVAKEACGDVEGNRVWYCGKSLYVQDGSRAQTFGNKELPGPPSQKHEPLNLRAKLPPVEKSLWDRISDGCGLFGGAVSSCVMAVCQSSGEGGGGEDH